MVSDGKGLGEICSKSVVLGAVARDVVLGASESNLSWILFVLWCDLVCTAQLGPESVVKENKKSTDIPRGMPE